MEIKTITIVGLGLIGGSLAKAIKRVKSEVNIIGIDPDRESIETALDEGSIDRAYTSIDENISLSDIVFVCAPVKWIISSIESITKVVKSECIITDTGSIKTSIIESIESNTANFNFIGGHPMCGSEKSGYFASTSHLFENAYYILTPCSKTSDNTLKVLEKIIIEIGGIPVIIDNKKHDIIAGTISHLPHIIASALVNTVKEMDYEEKYMEKLAAGGFKDITRISSSIPDAWRNIILNNRVYIIGILAKFSEQIDQFALWLKKDKSEEIYNFFNSAKKYRDNFTSNNIGFITPFYDITVDIKDQPGEIGKLATLLGENNINIKNINVSNSREYDQGCLRITFQDANSINKACFLLKEQGYTIQKYE